MKIRIKDLKEIINILSKKIDENFEDTIDIETEKYFWEIPEDKVFDVFKDTPQLLIGDVEEDWNELMRLRNKDEIPVSYDIKRLAIIFQLIRFNSRGIW